MMLTYLSSLAATSTLLVVVSMITIPPSLSFVPQSYTFHPTRHHITHTTAQSTTTTFTTTPSTTTTTTTTNNPRQLSKLYKTKKDNDDDNDESLTELLFTKYENEIDQFCQSTYNLMKASVIPPVRNYVEIQKNKKSKSQTETNFLTKLIAPPELPGISRPVWLVILGSIPTGLLWYGYYKFSIEEELYQLELDSPKGKVSGLGGYGTLFPFVYGILLGFPLSLLPGTPGNFLIDSAGVWILVSQLNLYRRVNELCVENETVRKGLGLVDDQPPLYEWWAILPPPLDVVVGLRQVHFLSEYWRITNGEEYDKDVVAETLFPFISWGERFTLKQFFRTPSKWFWFTKDIKDFEYEFLKD